MSKIKTASVTDYDTIYKQYIIAQHKFYDTHTDASRKELFDILPKDLGIVLDAGCGNGIDSRILNGRGAKLVIGKDISHAMIAECRKKFDRYKGYLFSCGTVYDTGMPDNFFDTIYSRYAIHYEADLYPIFSEFHRILKPKGHFGFIAPHPVFDYKMIAPEQKNNSAHPLVTTKIYNGSIEISYPSHRMSDYINPAILNKFDLKEFIEEINPPNEETPYMIMLLQKK